MPDFLDPQKFNGAKPNLQQTLRKYDRPNLLKAVWQLANTFISYLILCILMYLSYEAGYSYWIILGLSILTAGLLVRVFIFFHDCAHQSFFASRKANTVLATATAPKGGTERGIKGVYFKKPFTGSVVQGSKVDS